MLHIILLILKIIGIVLLCLLGLALLFIALILFVPVRYRMNVSYLEKKLKAGGRITWLLHAVTISGFYDGEAEENKGGLSVRLFGIRIVDTSKKSLEDSGDNPKKKPLEDGRGNQEKKRGENTADLKADHNTETESTVKQESGREKTDAVRVNDTVADENEEKKNEEQIVEHTKKRKTISEKLTGFKAKIVSKIKGIKIKLISGWKKLCEKASALCKKKDKLMEILFSEKNRPVFVFLKRCVFKLIGHILPKRIDGWVHFGMDDPEKTGRLLGKAAVFYPIYAHSLKIAPDFENEVFEAKLLAAGRIRAFTLAATGIKIILNKDIKRILSELKHL